MRANHRLTLGTNGLGRHCSFLVFADSPIILYVSNNICIVLSHSHTTVSRFLANLASFLVSPQISIYKYSTIESVLAKDATICMQDEAILQTILEEKYPEIKTIGKDSEQAIFEGLRLPKHKGGCDAVGHQIFSFELYERDQEVCMIDLFSAVCSRHWQSTDRGALPWWQLKDFLRVLPQ